MDFKEVIAPLALRKFDAMCLHNEYLRRNKEFQEQILSWVIDTLVDDRKYWDDIRATTIDAIVTEDRKAQAKKRSKARDTKYAPFREYFKNIQQKRFNEYQNAGRKLTANRFVEWFLENLSPNIKIPYRQSNLKNKLIQLAQQNNRELKGAFER